MATKYIVDNLSGQTITGDLVIDGSLSATTISTTTLYVSGNSISRPYKVYSALLTQTGTSDPTAIVLENQSDLVITYARTDVGVYEINSTSFVRGKVIINNMNPYIESLWELANTSVNFPKISTGGGPPSTYRDIRIPSAMYTTGTSIYFNTVENNVNADDVLSKYNAFIEIRVYN